MTFTFIMTALSVRKNLKRMLVFSAFCITAAYAQDKHHSPADAVSAASAGHMADGEIKKVNRDSKKMTIDETAISQNYLGCDRLFSLTFGSVWADGV
jgi:Cu/Ag efflux protein CusF